MGSRRKDSLPTEEQLTLFCRISCDISRIHLATRRQQGQEKEKKLSHSQLIPLAGGSTCFTTPTTDYHHHHMHASCHLVGIWGANNTIFTSSEYHSGEARHPMMRQLGKLLPAVTTPKRATKISNSRKRESKAQCP